MEAVLFASNVAQWAEDRNLVKGSSPDAQFGKLMEESIELYTGLRLNNLEEIKDGVGDAEVVLRVIECQLGLEFKPGEDFLDSGDAFAVYLCSIGRLAGRIRKKSPPMFIGQTIADARRCLQVIANLHSLTIDECREYAWNEIKDRKGRMIDGVFVKEAS